MAASPYENGAGAVSNAAPSLQVNVTASETSPTHEPRIEQLTEPAIDNAASNPKQLDTAAQSPNDEEKQANEVPWETDPANALNWSAWRKAHLTIMLASYGFVA